MASTSITMLPAVAPEQVLMLEEESQSLDDLLLPSVYCKPTDDDNILKINKTKKTKKSKSRFITRFLPLRPQSWNKKNCKNGIFDNHYELPEDTSIVFTDVDSSAHNSILGLNGNGFRSSSSSSGSSSSSSLRANGRIPGGCLKVTTQRDSLSMYYKNIPNTTSTTRARTVQWGTLTMNSHAMILGDNPCAIGPPVSISWKSFESVTISVNDYEMNLQQRRRILKQLILPKSVRMDLLKHTGGYSRGELLRATDQNIKIRQLRNQNAKPTMKETFHQIVVGRRFSSTSATTSSRSLHQQKPLPYATAELSDSIRTVNALSQN